MPSKTIFTKEIAELVKQANDVGVLCSDEAVRWSTNDFLAVDIHNKYMIWKCDVQEFLQKHDLLLEAKFFMVENTVPMVKGGIEYGDKNSEQSRGLIKAISLDLDEKLKHLRELSRRVNNKKTEKVIKKSNKLIVHCSLENGVYIDEKKLYQYKISKQRFMIIEMLHKNGAARLKEITKKVGISSTQNTSRDIRTINKEIKRELNLKHNFIEKNTAVGFHLNNMNYDIFLQ